MSIRWPSTTNMGAALLKLAHQFEPERLYEDHYIAWFVDARSADAAKTLMSEAGGSTEESRFLRIAYLYTILRELHVDNWIRYSMRSGCRQLFLLGAGYDTRFFRLPEITDNAIDTFEVDLPETIRRKAALLRMHCTAIPEKLHFIPLDLNHEDLSSVTAYGFDFSIVSAYVWQGVSYYLPQRTVAEVLHFLHSHMVSGSTFVFDFCSPYMTYLNDQVPGTRFNIERLNKINEPYLFGLAPERMKEWLEEIGFTEVCINSQSDLELSILRTRTLPENMWYIATAER